MQNGTAAGNARKPYTKPMLERVRLNLEESVLKGCKFNKTAGGLGGATNNCASSGCSNVSTS